MVRKKCHRTLLYVNVYWILQKFSQDIMIKVKQWVSEEKKHVRFYGEWNEKEVWQFVCV